MRIFATSVSTRASAPQSTTSTTGSSASWSHALSRVRHEDLRGEHEHDPVARRRAPLQEREIAPAVLEHRPLVDHRQLEVRVGVVERLPPGLGEDDEREPDRAEREAG